MPDDKYYAEKKEGTILFCDVRNFTSLFEDQDPLKAFHFANTVLARLGQEVEAINGTVDRFTGDGFLAHFGVANQSDNHVADACRAALNMRNALKEINNQRFVDVKNVVSAGIGIHTGTVAYGEIKTEQISHKTVLGDVVNTGSRIQVLTKYFSVDILISEAGYKRVEDDFLFQEMPQRKVKGLKENIPTYWLLPMNE